jgi:hypothetical protein
MSIAQRCVELASLFEAELLTELMLRFWQHPFADDSDFRSSLLESATEALQQATEGERLLDSLSPENTNFVAALWYVEWVSMRASETEDPSQIHQRREQWLGNVKRSIPSCFKDDVA